MASADESGAGPNVERFDAYVERCLYGPDGFYATTGTAGRRRGDFLTSPEVGPLFGAVLTRALVAVWEAAGSPNPFTVYDVGCGPGTLLRTVSVALDDLVTAGALTERERSAWSLVGVDRVTTGGASTAELPDDLSAAVVVANELLDNLPFRVLVGADGDGAGLSEVHVGAGPGGPVEVLWPVRGDGLPGWLPSGLDEELTPGRRAPLLERARAWVDEVRSRRPLTVLAFDYGAPTSAELATRGGWLRTYRQHHRGADPLAEPGRSDITTDVAWDQLPAPDRLETQADFLRRFGVDELVEEGRLAWRAAAAAPDVRALRMRSRTVEVDALLDPDGLGAWWVATWSNLDDGSPLGLSDAHG